MVNLSMFKRGMAWNSNSLCLWHVCCAWQKHYCFKIKDIVGRGEVLRELGLMMNDKSSPNGFESTTWAKDKLDELSKNTLKRKTSRITCKNNGKGRLKCG